MASHYPLLPAPLAAAWLGITTATLRDWRRRELITPAGGTLHKPMYSGEDLKAAAQRAAAPRQWRPAARPSSEGPLLTTARAAIRAGVKPGTIRVWRHRGLIAPAGGTERHPLFRASGILAAMEAEKPRLRRSADLVAG